jgi:hypothetical protein
MMNVVEMICIGAVISLRRWLQHVVLAVCIGQRSQRLRSACSTHGIFGNQQPIGSVRVVCAL